MLGNPPPKIRLWPRFVICGLLLFLVLFALTSIGPISHVSDATRKAEARVGVADLASTLQAYSTEYGKWPDFVGDGLFLDEARNARLIQVLCAKDDVNNPRKILFFVGKTAAKGSTATAPYRSGLSPVTGAFLDPWGNPYRIAIDADYSGRLANPYPDDASPINAKVISWSFGKDGKQGAPTNSHTTAGSDDVTSWPPKSLSLQSAKPRQIIARHAATGTSTKIIPAAAAGVTRQLTNPTRAR